MTVLLLLFFFLGGGETFVDIFLGHFQFGIFMGYF